MNAYMTITRDVPVTKFIDAAGERITELESVDIEVTIEGSLCAAEPDVGIMSDWVEDLTATDEHGNEYELTDHERGLAEEALFEAAEPDPDLGREDAYERRRTWCLAHYQDGDGP